MKIVIDIPEKVVTAIKNGEDYRYDIHTAIAQGIPYNPSGDLISRDYVEKIIMSEFVNLQDDTQEWRNYVNDTCESILNKVHNAPTVEPCYQTTSCLDCKMYDKEKHNCPRFCEVIRSVIEDKRPQGEWKETGYETGAFGITYRQTQCSNCGWEHALPMWWNFCPNCGADMKGGAE